MMTEVDPVYGPAAEFSEHKIGDMITYRQQHDWDNEPQTYTGEILWVAAATDERGICYIVAPDVPTGFIDHVYPGEVVIQP
jgi:hypothetical protein